MGNPAGMRRKKSEKRRAKFEQRLGIMAYVPREIQEEIKKELAEELKKSAQK